MRTEKPDKHNSKIILHGDNDPVFIPLDVEHNPVSANKAGIPMHHLDFGRTFPVRMFDIMVPCLQRLLRIRMSLPKLSKYFP